MTGYRHWQPIVLIFREAVFDGHVLALDIAGFFEAPMERGDKMWVIAGRPGVEEPDHWHRRLLRTRRERPHDRRAA